MATEAQGWTKGKWKGLDHWTCDACGYGCLTASQRASHEHDCRGPNKKKAAKKK